MTSTHTPERATPGTLALHLDRIGFSRAQFWVLMLILAGMFFDTLEQNSVGAMGANLKLALGITDTQLTAINTATVLGGLVGRLMRRMARRPVRPPRGAVAEPAALHPRRAAQRGRRELRDDAGQPFRRRHRAGRRVHHRHRDARRDGRHPAPGRAGRDAQHRLRRRRQLPVLRAVLPAPRPARPGTRRRPSRVALDLPVPRAPGAARGPLPAPPPGDAAVPARQGPRRGRQPLARDPGFPLSEAHRGDAGRRPADHGGRAHSPAQVLPRRGVRPRCPAPHALDRRRVLDGLRRAGHAQLPDADAARGARLLHFGQPALHHDHERRVAARRLRRRVAGRTGRPAALPSAARARSAASPPPRSRPSGTRRS